MGHPEEINVGDLVTDTVIIPSDPSSCWIGIVLEIIKKSEEHILDVKYIKNRNKVVVYWFYGSSAGKIQKVPDWFVKVLSKADDM